MSSKHKLFLGILLIGLVISCESKCPITQKQLDQYVILILKKLDSIKTLKYYDKKITPEMTAFKKECSSLKIKVRMVKTKFTKVEKANAVAFIQTREQFTSKQVGEIAIGAAAIAAPEIEFPPLAGAIFAGAFVIGSIIYFTRSRPVPAPTTRPVPAPTISPTARPTATPTVRPTIPPIQPILTPAPTQRPCGYSTTQIAGGCSRQSAHCRSRRSKCVDHMTMSGNLVTYNTMDTRCRNIDDHNHSELKMWALVPRTGLVVFNQDKFPCAEGCDPTLRAAVQAECRTNPNFLGLEIRWASTNWENCLRNCCEDGRVPRNGRCDA